MTRKQIDKKVESISNGFHLNGSPASESDIAQAKLLGTIIAHNKKVKKAKYEAVKKHMPKGGWRRVLSPMNGKNTAQRQRISSGMSMRGASMPSRKYGSGSIGL